MAYHTIEDGPWPQGVTVAVYPVASVDVGSPIDTAIAQPDGTATFGGLTEGAQYTAVGSGGTQTFYARNQESTIAGFENRLLSVTAQQYGAFGLGLVNEFAALQAGLTAAAGGEFEWGEGIWLWSGTLVVPSNTRVKAHPNAILKPQSNQSAIYFDSPTARTPGTTYAITADTAVGSYTITSAAAAAVLAVGDVVTLRDPTYTLGGENVRREMNVVESVASPTVTLRYPIGHVYAAANSSWVAKVTPASNIHWTGGQIDMDAVAGGIAADCDAIEALYPQNCTVNDLTVFNQPDKGVDFYCPIESSIRRCNSYSPDLSGSGEGYNMRLQYGRNSTIEGGWSRNVRHHADITGGQNCWILGGFSSGRTGAAQVGAFLHGLEERWCGIREFVGENLTDVAGAGNASFGASFDFTIADCQATGCDSAFYAEQGATGKITRPYVRNPAANQDAIQVIGAGTNVLIENPDVDMGGIGASGVGTSSLNASSRVFVKGGRIVMGNASGTVTAIILNLPTGAAGAYGGVEGTIIEGTMVRGIGFPGASTEQSVRNVQFRGTSIGEAIRSDAGEVLVDGCQFSGTVTTAVRAATSTAKVTLGPNLWGSAGTRLSNTASAVQVGTTKLDTEGTVAPAAGTWAVGDRCWKTDVAAAGIPGWVCTTAGSPGTWKAMAAVAA